MFGFMRRKAKKKAVTTLIGEDACVKGDLSFSGGLRIDGEVHGDVIGAPDSPVLISEKAVVDGEVFAGEVIIGGKVLGGPVRARQSLALLPDARVAGDVTYRRIEMHEGAVVEGRMMHESDEPETASVSEAVESIESTVSQEIPHGNDE